MKFRIQGVPAGAYGEKYVPVGLTLQTVPAAGRMGSFFWGKPCLWNKTIDRLKMLKTSGLSQPTNNENTA